MYKKAILIVFLIISLLLIGMMFLIVDVRNNPVLDDSTTLNTEIKSIELEETGNNVDSLEEKIKSQKSKDQSSELEKFNIITEDVLGHIKFLQEKLFPGGLEVNDLSTPKIEENNELFFKENGKYTNEAAQFIAKLDTFENYIRVLKQAFSELKTVKTEIREEYTKGLDWLDFNFKDFPAIASHVKLKQLANAIKSKREDIFTAVLSN